MTGAIIIEPEAGVNSRKANQSREVLADPVLQGEGPKKISTLENQGDPFVDGETSRLWQAWTQALVPLQDADGLLERLRIVTKNTCLFPSEIRQTYKNWQAYAAQTEELNLQHLGILRIFEDRFAFEWFQTGCQKLSPHKDASLCMERLAAQMHQQAFVCYREPIHAPVIFAHLFSGHRRTADIQECLEKKGCVMISVDIIFNVSLGDLNRPETFNLFRRALEQNVLQGFVAGPPCETWSRARGRALSDGTLGPRVVRTNARPYGKVDLTRKEDEQVTFGSRLLAVALKLTCVALVHGKTVVLEHPAGDEDEPHLVSIWKTSILKVIQLFPRVSKVRVLQGHYGGKTVKPTDLLLVNGADDAKETLYHQRTTQLPLASAIGKDTEGRWKTAELKVYPPGLCEAIATLCANAQPIPKDAQQNPSWFEEVIVALNASFDVNAEMGQDFGNKGQQLKFNDHN